MKQFALSFKKNFLETFCFPIIHFFAFFYSPKLAKQHMVAYFQYITPEQITEFIIIP